MSRFARVNESIAILYGTLRGIAAAALPSDSRAVKDGIAESLAIAESLNGLLTDARLDEQSDRLRDLRQAHTEALGVRRIRSEKELSEREAALERVRVEIEELIERLPPTTAGEVKKMALTMALGVIRREMA